MPSRSFVCLDVGEKRIGIAVVDSSVRIAVPYDTFETDGTEIQKIAELVIREGAQTIVVGYPRNQQGEATAQTEYVENFAKQLVDIGQIEYQDESLTSVMAEERLKRTRKTYTKGDIDMQAASIILQDYLEEKYGA